MLTLTLNPTTNPETIYPIATQPQTVTARRIPRRRNWYTITNPGNNAFPLAPGDVVTATPTLINQSDRSTQLATSNIPADMPIPGDMAAAQWHRITITTIIRLQPGNLVYGDTPTDPIHRKNLRAFLQRRACYCHVDPLFFTSYWPPDFDADTFRRFFADCPAPVHHYVHLTCRARRDALLRDTDVGLSEWVDRLLPAPTAADNHGVHVVVRQQNPVRLFLTLVDAHRGAYPDMSEMTGWLETTAWVLNSPHATLLRRSLRDVGLLDALCGQQWEEQWEQDEPWCEQAEPGELRELGDPMGVGESMGMVDQVGPDNPVEPHENQTEPQGERS